ncbi:signal peptidase II [Xylanimonas oleitrophica]|uniref:Lipoprotein signal peptidase n=1 Tax=Xylanimonas oleitrophica TaxID=2607479 RepID=A0A2W5WXR7_9MICO|nr:signal peptidase II [Xylanimonas oleitrophica]PZR55452.1 signal peptidase II [Xylanimonas oleitrophica]
MPHDTDATPVPSQPSPEGPRPASRRLVVATALLAAVVLAADQLTKWWATAALTLGDAPVPLVGDLLSLRLIYNPGAALSIATGYTWVLTLVVIGVVVAIVRTIRRLGSRGWAVALGLLLGGAVGNLVDRLAREPGFARGHVVDFIDYAGFFVGNVADIAIVVAAVLMVVLSVRGIGVDGRREGQGPGEKEEPGEGTDGEAATVEPGDGAGREVSGAAPERTQAQRGED